MSATNHQHSTSINHFAFRVSVFKAAEITMLWSLRWNKANSISDICVFAGKVLYTVSSFMYLFWLCNVLCNTLISVFCCFSFWLILIIFIALSPYWDSAMNFTISVPEICLVRFCVRDQTGLLSSEFVGQYTLPFTSMKKGETQWQGEWGGLGVR